MSSSNPRRRSRLLMAIPLTLASMFGYATGSGAYAANEDELQARLVKVEQQLEQLQQRQAWVRSLAYPRPRSPGADSEAGSTRRASPWTDPRHLWDRH